MDKTRELLLVIFCKDTVGIILEYVMAKRRDWESIAEAGEWETCLQKDADRYDCLVGACLGGYRELAVSMIARVTNSWDIGLYGACFGGHCDLVELMIAQGANNWDWGLAGACRGGSIATAKLMIEQGADNLNWGLTLACSSKHREMSKFMIACGATQCCNRTHYHDLL